MLTARDGLSSPLTGVALLTSSRPSGAAAAAVAAAAVAAVADRAASPSCCDQVPPAYRGIRETWPLQTIAATLPTSLKIDTRCCCPVTYA